MSFTKHQRNLKTGKDEWLTPPELIAALGPFDLDPCSPGMHRAPWRTASRMIALPEDGLTAMWTGRVWLNPPYGKKAPAWLAKLSRHGNGVALVFARTDTAWFHETVFPHAHALFYFRGRLRFHHVNGSAAENTAGAPSFLVAYGERNVQALEELSNRGFSGAFQRLRSGALGISEPREILRAPSCPASHDAFRVLA